MPYGITPEGLAALKASQRHFDSTTEDRSRPRAKSDWQRGQGHTPNGGAYATIPLFELVRDFLYDAGIGGDARESSRLAYCFMDEYHWGTATKARVHRQQRGSVEYRLMEHSDPLEHFVSADIAKAIRAEIATMSDVDTATAYLERTLAQHGYALRARGPDGYLEFAPMTPDEHLLYDLFGPDADADGAEIPDEALHVAQRIFTDVGQNERKFHEALAQAMRAPAPVIVSEADASKLDLPSGVSADFKNTGGMKYDAGKTRWDLLPRWPLYAASQVFAYGAKKYRPWNWTLGMSYSQAQRAVMGHLLDWADGEDLDPESNMPHLWHALTMLMILLDMTHNHRELDDRRGKMTKQARISADEAREKAAAFQKQ
jgi:hypothetical protein